jgi:O-antigen/teichoic acid export membrane protein
VTAAPRPLTGGVVMGAASRIVVALTGAATTILIARALGPGGSGSFAAALTLLVVLTVFTTLGLEHGIAYYVSAGRWAPADAFRVSQRVALLAGVPGAGAGVLLRLALPAAFGDLTVLEAALAAGALPFSLSWFYASFVGLADDHYEAYVLPPALQSSALFVLALALAIPFGVTGAVVALLASQAAAAIATFAWSRRRLRPAHPRGGTESRLRLALSFGIKGYAANALQVLNSRVDFFVLSAVAGAVALGHYAVAVAVTTVLLLMPQAVGDVLFPRVAALSAEPGEDAVKQRAFVEDKSLRHTTLAVVAGAALVAAGLVLLVVPIYGAAFQDSIALGLIRLPGVALAGIGGTLAATIVGRGHPEYSLYTTLISTPVTMVLYAVLIPAFDATGAALASSLSFTTTFLLLALFYRRATGHGVLSRLVPTRSELHDYRALPPQIRAWAAGIVARPRD